MRDVTRPSTFPVFVLAFIVAVSSVMSLGIRAQRAQGGASKKVLFLAYPGVGARGSHGHASLPAAVLRRVGFGVDDEIAVAIGKEITY